jgi:hypothetical protein
VVKKKLLKPKKIKKNEKASELSSHDNQEGRFDFGGLPKMNLKKNLGCG